MVARLRIQTEQSADPSVVGAGDERVRGVANAILWLMITILIIAVTRLAVHPTDGTPFQSYGPELGR